MGSFQERITIHTNIFFLHDTIEQPIRQTFQRRLTLNAHPSLRKDLSFQQKKQLN